MIQQLNYYSDYYYLSQLMPFGRLGFWVKSTEIHDYLYQLDEETYDKLKNSSFLLFYIYHKFP